MNPEFLIPILVPIACFLWVFGIMYLKSRENMALIERGINPKQHTPQPRPFVNLKYGLLLLGCGLGLLAAILIDGTMNHTKVTSGGFTYHDDFEELYFALIAIGGGLGLVVSYAIEKKQWLDKRRSED